MSDPLVRDDQLDVVHALNPAQNATAPVADHGEGADLQPRAPHLEGLIPVESIAAAHRQQVSEPLGELNWIVAAVGLGQGQQG